MSLCRLFALLGSSKRREWMIKGRCRGQSRARTTRCWLLCMQRWCWFLALAPASAEYCASIQIWFIIIEISKILIVSYCWLTLVQLSLTVAFSSLFCQLLHNWRQVFVVCLYQLYEVLSVHHDLGLVLDMFASLCLESISSWTVFVDYEITVLLLFLFCLFWLAEVSWNHAWVLRLIVLENLEIFDSRWSSIIPLSESNWLLLSPILAE